LLLLENTALFRALIKHPVLTIPDPAEYIIPPYAYRSVTAGHNGLSRRTIGADPRTTRQFAEYALQLAIADCSAAGLSAAHAEPYPVSPIARAAHAFLNQRSMTQSPFGVRELHSFMARVIASC
jgi:hypothetical protein